MGSEQSNSADIEIYDAHKLAMDKIGKEFPFISLWIKQSHHITPGDNIVDLARQSIGENFHVMKKYVDHVFDGSNKSAVLPVLYALESSVKVSPSNARAENANTNARIDKLSHCLTLQIAQQLVRKLRYFVPDSSKPFALDPEVDDYMRDLEQVSTRFFGVQLDNNPMEMIPPDNDFLNRYLRSDSGSEEFERNTIKSLSMIAYKFKDFPALVRSIRLAIILMRTPPGLERKLGGLTPVDFVTYSVEAIAIYYIGRACYELVEVDPLKNNIQTALTSGDPQLSIKSVIIAISRLSVLRIGWFLYTLVRTSMEQVRKDLKKDGGGPFRHIISDPAPVLPEQGSRRPVDLSLSVSSSGMVRKNKPHQLGEFFMDIYQKNAESVQEYLADSSNPVDKNLEGSIAEMVTKLTVYPHITQEITPLVDKSIKLMVLSMLSRLNSKMPGDVNFVINDQDQAVLDSIGYVARRIIIAQPKTPEVAVMSDAEIINYMARGDVHEDNASSKIQAVCTYVMRKYASYPIIANYIDGMSALIGALAIMERRPSTNRKMGGTESEEEDLAQDSINAMVTPDVLLARIKNVAVAEDEAVDLDEDEDEDAAEYEDEAVPLVRKAVDKREALPRADKSPSMSFAMKVALILGFVVIGGLIVASASGRFARSTPSKLVRKGGTNEGALIQSGGTYSTYDMAVAAVVVFVVLLLVVFLRMFLAAVPHCPYVPIGRMRCVAFT